MSAKVIKFQAKPIDPMERRFGVSQVEMRAMIKPVVLWMAENGIPDITIKRIPDDETMYKSMVTINGKKVKPSGKS